MTAAMLEECLSRLAERRRYARESALIGCALVLLAAGTYAVVQPGLGVALLAGATVQFGLAGLAVVRRRQLVADLAVEPSAYAIREVARHGERLVRPRERLRLAARVARLLGDAARPRASCVAERVLAVRDELEQIGRDLASPAVAVEPACAAQLGRLVAGGAGSPFYEASLPAEELRRRLARVRAGFRPRRGDAGRPGTPET